MIRRIDQSKRTLIVDGSLFVYRIASALEEATQWEDDMWTLHADAKLGKKVVDTTLGNYKSKLNCDKIIIAEDHKKNFRHDIYPKYKSHRKKVRKPNIVKPLKEYLQKNYECVSLPNLEGDDVCGILATKPENKDKVVVLSGDKDMRTIPCNLSQDGMTVEQIPEKIANYNFMIQTIMGDKTDGYDGIDGVGIKTAEKLLLKYTNVPLLDLWKIVKGIYKEKGYTQKEALQQARVAHILRHGEYNKKTGKVKLWTI